MTDPYADDVPVEEMYASPAELADDLADDGFYEDVSR